MADDIDDAGKFGDGNKRAGGFPGFKLGADVEPDEEISLEDAARNKAEVDRRKREASEAGSMREFQTPNANGGEIYLPRFGPPAGGGA